MSDARFEVVNSKLQLINGAILDFETEPTVTLKVYVQDAGQLPKPQLEQEFTLIVHNVNEPPTGVEFVTFGDVKENSAGAEFGQVIVHDPDAGDTFIYTVDDDRFEIVESILKLKPNRALDFESTPTITLHLTAQDQGSLPSTPLPLTVTLTVVNVNEAPTAVRFEPVKLLENDAGAVAGKLITTDPDKNDTFVYTWTDPRFQVVGDTLKLMPGVALNFESTPEVSVDITARDAGGLPLAALTLRVDLHVSNGNDAPTAINFTPSAPLPENTPGAVAGTLSSVDPDAGDTFTYTVDDLRFQVIDDTLALTADASLDYETEPKVPLTITVHDSGGSTFTKTITVDVGNRNEPPTAIIFSPSGELFENADGAVAGTVRVVDPDADDTFVYTLSDGRFEIVGGILRLKKDDVLDFETEPSVSVKLSVHDSGGLPAAPLTVDLTLAVQNRNEPPTAISFTRGTPIPENTPGESAGTFKITDPDVGDTFTYEVDDTRFEVVGNDLRLKSDQALDFESGSSVTMTVSVRDLGHLPTAALKKTVTLSVTNRNEAPTEITFDPGTLTENTPGCVAGRLRTLDPDTNDVFTYAVDDVRFEIADDRLRLKAGVAVDYEAEPAIEVHITSHDAGNQFAPILSLMIRVVNRNEPPTAIGLAVSGTLYENTVGAEAGILSASDPDIGDSFTYAVADGRFKIDGTSLRLNGAQALDFETQPTLVLPVTVTDAAGATFTQNLTLMTVDRNDPPTVPSWAAVQLAVVDASTPLPLAEATDVVTDEDLHSTDSDYLDYHGFHLRLAYDSNFDDHFALTVPNDLAPLYFLLNGEVYLKGTNTGIASYRLSAQEVTFTLAENRPSTVGELSHLVRLVVFTPDADRLDNRDPLAINLHISGRDSVDGWTGTRMLALDAANLPPTLLAPKTLEVTRFSQISITPAMLGISDEHADLGLTLFIDYPTFYGRLYTAQHSKLLGPDDQVPITYAQGALQLDLIYIPDSGVTAPDDTCFLSVRDHGARVGAGSDSWLRSLPSKVSLHIAPGNVPLLTNLGSSTFTEGAEAVSVVKADTKLELEGTRTPESANLGGWNFYVSYAHHQPRHGPSATTEILGVQTGNGISMGDDGRTVMFEGHPLAQIEATATGSASALVFILSNTCTGGDVVKLARALTYRDTSLRLPLIASDLQADRSLYFGFVNKTDPGLLADASLIVKRTGIDNPPVFNGGDQRTIITVSNQPVLGSSVIEDIDTQDGPEVHLTPVSGGTATVLVTRGPVDTGTTYRTTLNWKITRDAATGGDQEFELSATIGKTTLTQRLTLSPRSGSDLALAIVSDAPLALIKPPGPAAPLQRAVRVRHGAAVVTGASVYLLGEVPPWIRIDSTAGTVAYDLADGGAVIGRTYRFSLLATTATSAAEQPVILRVVGPSAESGSN